MRALAKNGRSVYGIWMRAQATEPERFAAAELRRYVRKVTGAALPVCAEERGPLAGAGFPALLLADRAARPGRPAARALAAAAAALKPRLAGSYAWQPAGAGLALMGRDGQGLLTGAYAFIEDALGVRFLAPGSDGEVIPKRSNVPLPATPVLREPAFRYRTFDMNMNTPITLDELDWYAKRGLNVLQSLPEVWDRTRDRWGPEMLVKRGWQLMVGSHISDRFFPKPELYFKKHPDYYGRVGGRRVPHQICYSNPRAVDLMIAAMVDYVRANPEIELFAPWPNDGDADTFCQCARCRKVPLVRLLFDANRRILEALRKVNPRIVVLHLVYMPAAQRGPPPGTTPVPGQIPLYCPYMSKSRYRPIYDVRYGRWWTDATRNHRAMCRDLRAWRRTHEVMIFTYNNDQVMRQRIYSPFPDVIQQELRFYKALGVSGIWDCLCGRRMVVWMDALNHYAVGRLTWDPDADLETLRREFNEGFYGAAGETVGHLDREVADFFRLSLPHGFQVDDIVWFYNEPWLDDYRPELDALARRMAGERLDRIQALGARAVAQARRERAVVRQRVARLAICLENQRRHFEMALAALAFAWWKRRVERAAPGPARVDALRSARAAFKTLKAAGAAFERSFGRWETFMPAVPGKDKFQMRIAMHRNLVKTSAQWIEADPGKQA